MQIPKWGKGGGAIGHGADQSRSSPLCETVKPDDMIPHPRDVLRSRGHERQHTPDGQVLGGGEGALHLLHHVLQLSLEGTAWARRSRRDLGGRGPGGGDPYPQDGPGALPNTRETGRQMEDRLGSKPLPPKKFAPA